LILCAGCGLWVLVETAELAEDRYLNPHDHSEHSHSEDQAGVSNDGIFTSATASSGVAWVS
jgi:hypothetical protein